MTDPCLAAGHLDKLRVTTSGDPDSGPVQASYAMVLDDTTVPLDGLIGQHLMLRRAGAIRCSHCGKETKKSYSQGFCFPCMRKLACCDLCVMSPERCHFEQGTCREPDWGERFCMQGHLVYLANSSGLKVGLTRPSQMPTRWLDQGASQGLLVCRTSTRQVAGFVEDALRSLGLSDRTKWQQLVTTEAEPLDLVAERDRVLAEAAPLLAELEQRFGPGSVQPLADQTPLEIQYPVTAYPEKAKGLTLDSSVEVAGTLLGVKGQYLLFEHGVFNVRRHTAYCIELSATPAPTAAGGPPSQGALLQRAH